MGGLIPCSPLLRMTFCGFCVLTHIAVLLVHLYYVSKMMVELLRILVPWFITGSIFEGNVAVSELKRKRIHWQVDTMLSIIVHGFLWVLCTNTYHCFVACASPLCLQFWGGAIFNSGTSSMEISDARFEGNSAVSELKRKRIHCWVDTMLSIIVHGFLWVLCTNTYCCFACASPLCLQSIGGAIYNFGSLEINGGRF